MQVVKIAVLPVSFIKKPPHPQLPSQQAINNFFDSNNPLGLVNYIHRNTFAAFEIQSYTIFKPVKIDSLGLSEEWSPPGSTIYTDTIINAFSHEQGINWNLFTLVMMITNHLESKLVAGFSGYTLVPRYAWFPLWYKFGPPNAQLAYYIPNSVCPTDRIKLPLPINIRQHELLHNLGFNHVFDVKGKQIINHKFCALGHGYALSAGNLYTTTYFLKGNLGFVQRMYNQTRFRDVMLNTTDQCSTINLLALETAHYQSLTQPASYYHPFLIVIKSNNPKDKTYFIEYRRESFDNSPPDLTNLRPNIAGFDRNLPFFHSLVIHSYDPNVKMPDERFVFECAMELTINVGGYLNQQASLHYKNWNFGIILPAVNNEPNCITVQICGLKYFKLNQ